MIKKTFAAVLVVFLMNITFAPTIFAKSKEISREQKFVAKLKTNIQTQGTGFDSKTELKLKDGTKLKGYISEISSEGIVVVDEITGENIPVTFPQVKQAKGNNWSTKSWIAVAAVVGLFVLIIVGVSQTNKS